MLNQQTEPLDEEEAEVAAEHVETQHGEDGTQVLIFRVIAKATPGKVTWDLAEALPLGDTFTNGRGAENLKTIGAARRLARKWLDEDARSSGGAR